MLQSYLVFLCLSFVFSDGSCEASSKLDAPLDVPTIPLRNGVELPVLSLGTAHVILEEAPDDSFMGFLPERTYRQAQLALERGIRAFDSARIYRSHKPLGYILGEWFRLGSLSREEVFVTTKVFHPNADRVATKRTHMYNMDDLSPEQVTEQVRQEIEEAMDDLSIGRIDLLLLHWPSSGKGAALGSDEDGTNPTTDKQSICRQRRLAAWKVLEDVYQKGWVRAIGVSNFSEKHLKELEEDGATITPMVNQIEASLSVMYSDIFRYCQAKGIVCQAFSPLKQGRLEEDTIVSNLCAKYNKSKAQIALRFLFQYGYAITVLSTNAERMVANHQIFDFELTPEEMDRLSAMPSQDGNWGLPTPYDLD